MSFADKHALETLPGRVAALQMEIGGLQTKLSDGAFYARDPAGFAAVSKQLGALQAELIQSEERWLQLEMLREEIEGA